MDVQDTLIQGYDPTYHADDYYYDEGSAERVVQFFCRYLKHSSGKFAGQPFQPAQWQEQILRTLFGWKRKDNDLRRYREMMLYVPRKNGKTTLAAGIVLYLLFADREPGAAVYSAASSRDQASLIFRECSSMIQQSPQLLDRCRIYETYKMVRLLQSRSLYRALSADSKTQHGLNASGIVIDELHTQPDDRLVSVLTTSTGARRQPLTCYLTTADYVRESICNTKYKYACDVRDRIIDDTAYLPVIYAAGKDDDWTSADTWRKANPNLGVTVSTDYFKRECERAKQVPSYANMFRRLHLNQQTEQDIAWLNMEDWRQCRDAALTPFKQLGRDHPLKGEACFGGLDLSTANDLSAFVLFFPGHKYVAPSFWLPKHRVVEKSQEDHVNYQDLSARGYLELCPGTVIDYERIYQHVTRMCQVYNVQCVAVDRWGATALSQKLQKDGIDVVGYGQGYRDMTPACRELERLVLAHGLKGCDHPILSWMAGNVQVEMDSAGNIKPVKKRKKARIDGIVALLMAVGISSTYKVKDHIEDDYAPIVV